ncbi:MAG: peptidylprolyl isomerase [Planctomycetota bacterium]
MRLLTLSVAALLTLLIFPACAQEDAAEDHPTREVDLEVISDPGHEAMTQTAPDRYKAHFHTTAGDFVIEVTRDWAPLGADRFYNLVNNGYYDGNRFFRVVPGFVVQWGMHGDPAVNQAWRTQRGARIQDDEVKQSNARGRVVFATSGPNARTTQLFVNFEDNARLDEMGFAPFGEVVEGMDVVDEIEAKYGQRPNQMQIHQAGNAYLDDRFPDLDHIITATIVTDEAEEAQDE